VGKEKLWRKTTSKDFGHVAARKPGKKREKEKKGPGRGEGEEFGTVPIPDFEIAPKRPGKSPKKKPARGKGAKKGKPSKRKEKNT